MYSFLHDYFLFEKKQIYTEILQRLNYFTYIIFIYLLLYLFQKKCMRVNVGTVIITTLTNL